MVWDEVEERENYDKKRQKKSKIIYQLGIGDYHRSFALSSAKAMAEKKKIAIKTE